MTTQICVVCTPLKKKKQYCDPVPVNEADFGLNPSDIL